MADIEMSLRKRPLQSYPSKSPSDPPSTTRFGQGRRRGRYRGRVPNNRVAGPADSSGTVAASAPVDGSRGLG
jgi:hypothetical protein